MGTSRVATNADLGDPYLAASLRARPMSCDTAIVVSNAKPPTASQYARGERDSTRRRTDALLHKMQPRGGSAPGSLNGRGAQIQGLYADLDSVFFSLGLESDLLSDVLSDFDSD